MGELLDIERPNRPKRRRDVLAALGPDTWLDLPIFQRADGQVEVETARSSHA